MLQRANASYQASAPKRQAPTFSQQTLPAAGTADGFQEPQPLYPSLSAHNRTGSTSSVSYKNPLKRTASQASASTRTYSTTSSMGATHGPGVLDQLHSNLGFEFDENDFVDDDDLGLDDESPMQPPLPKPAAISSTKTLHPPSSTLRTSQIPWSSSPLDHKATPPNAHVLRRPSPPTVDLTQEDPQSEQEEVIEPPKKRRGLPWAGQKTKFERAGTDPVQYPDLRGVEHSVEQIRAYTAPAGNTSTPAPRRHTQSTPAWNKTASAIKEEKKQHRQQKGAAKPAKEIPASQPQVIKSTTRNKKLSPVFLSEEQKKVLDLVAEKKQSVFFTGSAGTGKSVLMREIIAKLKQKYSKDPDRVAVTASTGLAACNIGGVTLHSFAGIGLGKEPAEQLVKKIKKNAKHKTRWMRTKCLVIDEISMVDGDLFDKLEHCARVIRGNGRPFGGIQLVVTGDFFQLPPVPDSGKVSKFAFEASTWSTTMNHTIGLTHVFRQKDGEFAGILNDMRVGKLSPKATQYFRELVRIPQNDSFISATELFPTRHEVANANAMRMRTLSGNTVDYVAIDGGSIQDADQRTRLLSNCMAEQTITLKKGAQVMLIKNIDDSLVNGSIGKVVSFMDEKTYDIYHETDSSGIDEFEEQLENGQVTQGKGSSIMSMAKRESSASTAVKFPLVRFKQQDGSSRDLLCVREQWKVEQPNGEVQASRTQVPLILAWALSIHKAQGQTLPHVKVNLGKIFEKGQAYVALSRATSKEGLQVLNFDPKKVQAHPKVKTFYDSLYAVGDAESRGAHQSKSNTMNNFMNDEDDHDAMMAAYGGM